MPPDTTPAVPLRTAAAARPIASVTLVAVVNEVVPSAAAVERFGAALAREARDYDVVLVVNEVDGAAAIALKGLVAAVPDTTVVFLGEAVHDDLARLVGIEHAVGDAVLFCDLLQDDPAVLAPLFQAVRDGFDLVVGQGAAGGRRARPIGSRLAFGAYRRAYAAMAGVALVDEPTGLRVLSRAAALFVAGKPHAELLLRARDIGASFPSCAVPLPPSRVACVRRRGHSWHKGIGMLLSVSSLPLRGASYAALLGGVASIAYSVYVFGVYLFQRNVAAGWTTISLQNAGMMFIFSVVLLFIGEYVIQIYASSPQRSRRHLVVRELRSPLSRRSGRLNVIDGEGRFQLGKPDWLEGPGVPGG